MVSVAHGRSLPEVLTAIVEGIAKCPNVVLARIWLLDRGDLCDRCRFREECPDQTRCLHLVASAGNPSDPSQSYSRLDGRFRRFPMGIRKIGRVANTGNPLLISGLQGDEDWIADPGWVRRELVRTFAAQPLVFRGEVLGVLAIFDSGVLGEPDFEWLRVVADHAAVSIANARAFEEIGRLRARLEEENDYLRQEVNEVLGSHGIVGSSPGLRKVLQQIELVAPTEAPVLVLGESGTGKELVARAVHDRSPRRERALIKVNCGAIAEGLFESEFFGHVKGAFTGALRDRPGRFELADGGTLFLDEIGEVSLAMQVRLLRVLQEQEVERVGDARTRKVNVRIVAATNRDLKREVEAGRFRQDLYYRLSVFPIEIPPLRERRDDIVPLATHFAELAARRLKRPAPRLTRVQADRLTSHAWPGNVRELQNVVERAVIVSGTGPLQLETGPSPESLKRTGDSASRRPALLTRDELRRQERDSIVLALRESRGRVFGRGGAAELLAMKPTTLASRIKALGLRSSRLASSAGPASNQE